MRIEVQGDPAHLEGFVQTLRDAYPPQARIDSLETLWLEASEALERAGNAHPGAV